MLQKVSDLFSKGLGGGLNTQTNVLGLEKNQSPDMMNMVVNIDQSIEKRLGSTSTNTTAFAGTAWASFDFGASEKRWLTVCAGTGVYASSNRGVSFVIVATDRSTTYQHLERSKNVLIMTSEKYDLPLYWAGSVGTYAQVLAPNSAPSCKYSINYQGYLILLNTNTSNRGFYYEDENSQLTGDYGDYFSIPSSWDDEITGAWILRRNLYVSTKYQLYRVTYVGGNPDWSYRKIKDFGFVPRTVQVIFIKDVGEVLCGMTWDRRIRLFDGVDDKIVSDSIFDDNKMCEFAMEKVSYAGSGPLVSFSAYDPNSQQYKLCVAVGANSTDVTHMINYNGSINAFFPYSNMPFNTMTVADSGNRQYLMAFSRDGYCYQMDNGNKDRGTVAINEHFASPFIYEKSPSEVSKANRLDLYFSATSSGTITYSDRINFSSSFTERRTITLANTADLQIKASLDVPSVHGVYQFKLSGTGNTADPWRLTRSDYFTHVLGIGES